jgi:UDP-N-acetylmuramoyl-L-alanyl-D-glutamate--2,6-diaminopimelate ligase
MLEKILRLIKKFIPKKIFRSAQPVYHYTLALAGAIIYRFPSKKIKVIAITGTKGKTSTTEILAKILETAGYKVATTSTLQFRVGNKITRNLYKMSMPGRMFIQKFLRQAVNSKCDFVILETTSEGAKMYRHKFIDFDGLIFTNISPEHIESHGSYEKYLEAKLKYAEALEKSSKKNKVLVVNTDDKESGRFFQQAPSAKQISFTLHDAEPFEIMDNSSSLTFENEKIVAQLPGKFNLYNILGASKMARFFGVSVSNIKKAVENLDKIRGRVEYVKVDEIKQDFEVIVDYAHTADSMEQFYQTFSNHNLICVFGATGGGRDHWKRSEMGKVADKYCSQIILTDDDSYDEKPEEIAIMIAEGIKNHTPKIITDRRLAIREALSKAKSGDIVALTGKGSDPFLMGPNGSKQKWDDATVAREELEKFLASQE